MEPGVWYEFKGEMPTASFEKGAKRYVRRSDMPNQMLSVIVGEMPNGMYHLGTSRVIVSGNREGEKKVPRGDEVKEVIRCFWPIETPYEINPQYVKHDPNVVHVYERISDARRN